MISADNKSMQEAGKTLFTLNGNDSIRELCEAREDYRRTWDSVKQNMEEKDTIIREKDTIIREKDATIRENETTIMEKDTTIAELKLSNEKLEAQLAELQQWLQNTVN